MRLKFIAAIETLATMENQISSHIGTCFEAENPVAFDTIPTNAVKAKWNPVRVVADKNRKNHQISKAKLILKKKCERSEKTNRN